MQLRKDYLKLKPIWRLEDGSRDVQEKIFVRLIENSNLKDCNVKRIIELIRRKERRFFCVENWK